MQKTLDSATNTPGFYRFVCKSSNGTTCDTNGNGSGSGPGGRVVVPFTPGPSISYHCDKYPIPNSTENERFILNPYTNPLQYDADLALVSDPAKANAQDCGRGWTGDLTARYTVRRCKYYKKTDGVDKFIKVEQTPTHIAYAAAQCTARNIQYREQCPPGTDQSKTIGVTRDLIMHQPVALDWRPAIAGTQQWSTSDIATNASRAQIKTEAALNDASRGKVPYVIPNLNPNDLTAVSGNNNDWSIILERGMNSAVPGSVERKLTGCSNAGNPCGGGRPGGNNIIFGYDKSLLNLTVSAAEKHYPDYDCKQACPNGVGLCPGVGTCHSLLGDPQPTCKGSCVQKLLGYRY